MPTPSSWHYVISWWLAEWDSEPKEAVFRGCSLSQGEVPVSIIAYIPIENQGMRSVLHLVSAVCLSVGILISVFFFFSGAWFTLPPDML